MRGTAIYDVEELETLSRTGVLDSRGYSLALELRAHGHEEASKRFVSQAIERWEGRERDAMDVGERHAYGDLLTLAERWEDARSVFVDLVEQQGALGPMNLLPHLGEIALGSGDVEEARRVERQLAALGRPGRAMLLGARIEAWYGDRSRAVSLLREAYFGETYVNFNPVGLHQNPWIDSLRDDPELQRLVRPRG